jgi:L-ascorbate metabolism protein UlaG (beta-lactamase superfamily)
MQISFLGHACFELTDGSTRILIDPFVSQNPAAARRLDDLEPTHIFLTHGHFDHVGDTVELCKRTGAQCVAISELATELSRAGVANVADPNLGGTVDFGAGWVRLVPAWHTSTTPNGTVNTPAGLVISVGGATIYHLGDTALFSDLALVGRRNPIDVCLMCIGGHYTMDRHDAAMACELVAADTVVPCHYNTFPLVEADAAAFKSDVERRTASTVAVLDPGQQLSV